MDENLKSCLSPFQELLSLKVEDERYLQLEPQQKKDRIFEAVRDVLIRESQNNPLIVVVEDLHWIDKTSEQILDNLIGWLAKIRIYLILLYRPEYTHQWGSKSYYHKIGLDQLTYRSGVELVQAILDGCEIAPELEEIILGRSSGNPLFIEELTHNLLENGSIDRHGNQCVLARKVSDVQVPDTIQGIIAARIDRIEDNLKGIMQVASVVGRDFAFRILETITGMREELKSYLLLGDFNSAHEFVEKGLQFFKAAEVEIDLGLFYWLRGMIKLESSELKKAHYFAEKALKLSQKIHQQWIEGFSWILLGRITGTTEKLQSEKAEEYILQGIQILEELKLKALYAPGYHYLGKFYADTGQKDKALDILKNAERLFQMMGMDYWLGRTQKLVGRIFAKSDFAR